MLTLQTESCLKNDVTSNSNGNRESDVMRGQRDAERLFLMNDSTLSAPVLNGNDHWISSGRAQILYESESGNTINTP